MGVSLLFMHIPPPITFPLRILPLKKWIALTLGEVTYRTE